MKPHRPLAFSILMVLLGSLWNAQPACKRIVLDWNTFRRPSWVVPPGQTISQAKADTDTVLIHGGLLQAPRFRDTLRWWTGTWAGQVPFYRPLPSLLFWGEWKLYGDWEDHYIIFCPLLYFAALYQFLRLSSDLFVYVRCPWPALAVLLSGLIFTDGLGMFPMRHDTNDRILWTWKNQPDSLCALFFFLALRAYLRALSASASISHETQNNASMPVAMTGAKAASVSHEAQDNAGEAAAPSPPLAGRKFVPERAVRWALLWYLASCASKEAGVVLPLLLIVLEAPALLSRKRPQIRAALARLTPLLIALPLFLLYRTWCLGTAVGFRYGSNGSWRWRLLSSAFGPVSASAVMRQWPTVALSLMLAVLLWNARAFWVQRKENKPRPIWRPLALSGVSIAVLIALNLPPPEPGSPLSERVAIALLQYLAAGCFQNAIFMALFMAGAVSGLRSRPLLACFSYFWVLLELALLAMSPSPPHRYYLLEGGYALWLGGGLAIFVRGFAPASPQASPALSDDASP